MSPHRSATALSIAAVATLAVAAPAAWSAPAPFTPVGQMRLAGPAPPFMAIAKARGVVYGGNTEPQIDPMVIVVRGKRVVSVWRQYELGECGSIDGASGPTVNAPIRKGRFRITRGATATDSDGQAVRISETITGTVTKTSIRGTSRIDAVPVSGSTATPCTSGTQHWTLKHAPGRIFGGKTSQNLAAVVELERGRGAVHHLHIGWRAPCATGGGLLYGDLLKNFILTGGRFADKWRNEFQQNDGTQAVVEYEVTGKVGRASASGTLQVSVTFISPDGANVDACSTPRVAFSADS